MLILLTIFLFIFIPLVMLIFRLARPRYNIQGFLVVLAVIAGLAMIILTHSDIPQEITLLHWQPKTLFPISPSLFFDRTSWYLALALVSLSFGIVITSIAQLSHTSSGGLQNIPGNIKVPQENPASSAEAEVKTLIAATTTGSISNWQLWAAILVLSSISLVAVSAGNLLTLLLAWAALDILELVILLSQTFHNEMHERAVLVFLAKLVGLVTLLFASLALWSQSGSLTFDALSSNINVILLISAGIHLGVLPLQLPFTQGLPTNRHLGSALTLITAASSYFLLVRVSETGISGPITPYLLGLAALAGVFTALKWLTVKDELEGRPYWMLGSGSLIIAAAILRLPSACLAWSIASLLSGGLIFSMALRHRNLLPLIILGAIGLSTLPFSSTWQGATLYRFSDSAGVSLTLFSLSSLLFLFTQSFLLAGFIRHSLREIYPPVMETSPQVERWVWLLYPLGLILLVVTQLAFGYLLVPDIHNLALASWVIGPLIVVIAGSTLFFFWRFPKPISRIHPSSNISVLKRVFSLQWLNYFLGRLFNLVASVFNLFSTVLEGDGGILWALVLFALILVFLQR